MALELASPVDKVQILIDGARTREHAIFYDKKHNMTRLPIFTQDDEKLTGRVILNFGSKKVEHSGIEVRIIGETETYHKDDQKNVFLNETIQLTGAGKLQGTMSIPFSFNKFEKMYETYYGLTGRIRYYVKAIVKKDSKPTYEATSEFALQLPLLGTFYHQGFEIQLRIADYLMINVHMNKTNLHLDDCLTGKIVVEQIHLMIKRVQVFLYKREIYNPKPELTYTEEEVLYKAELSDTCPRKGDVFPFKIEMGSLEISPSLMQSNEKLSTKYVVVVSFIDEQDRSLFKPIELDIWRKRE